MQTAMRPDQLTSDYRLLSRLFFRLLPYQILLIVINAVNGIVDGLFASNAIGTDAMSAIGLYAPMNHFLYAISIMMVSGSQLLYGIYRAMGMSMKEIVKMLITEQIFSSFLATLSGFGVGALTTVLFTKLLSIVYLPRKHNLPITIFFRLQDSIRMIAIIAAAFTVCFFIMRRLIRNMNITTALKMGED